MTKNEKRDGPAKEAKILTLLSPCNAKVGYTKYKCINIIVYYVQYDRLSPLMIACLEGHARVVELLIAAKADIEGRSLKDATPLILAVGKGRTKCVDVLIRNGARINAKTNVCVNSNSITTLVLVYSYSIYKSL